MNPRSFPLSGEALDAVARRFRLLGEPARLRLLQVIETGERTVNELAEATGAGQANVSRHLTAMFDAGILSRRRDGNSIYYSVADPLVFRLCDLVCASERERAEIRLGALAENRNRKRAVRRTGRTAAAAKYLSRQEAK